MYTSIHVDVVISLVFAGSKDEGQGQRLVAAVIFVDAFVRFESVDLRIKF